MKRKFMTWQSLSSLDFIVESCKFHMVQFELLELKNFFIIIEKLNMFKRVKLTKKKSAHDKNTIAKVLIMDGSIGKILQHNSIHLLEKNFGTW